jgi:pimeloyl-ACP methyl ester carboxylesterase
MKLTHGMADIEPGLRLHYVTVGEGPRTIVLLHGFPQTWWEWHALIDPLVARGFRVLAPDYRGAGQSWRPAGGYASAPWRTTSSGSCATTSASTVRSWSLVTTSD